MEAEGKAARPPSPLQLAGGKSKRQRIWDAIRRTGVPDADPPPRSFTVAEMSRLAKVEEDMVLYILKGLCAAGYVRMLPQERSPRRGMPGTYQFARDAGVEAPRVKRDGSENNAGRGSEALWAAANVLELFQLPMLADLACVSRGAARAWAATLAKAGMLERLPAEKGLGPIGVAATYRVAPGHRGKPRAPIISHLRAVYDPNEHRIVWAEGADEAAEATERGDLL